MRICYAQAMEADLQLLHLLKSAASCAEKELADALAGFELSLCQASLLLHVEHRNVSMSALSRILCCHKSNITQIVDGLEKHGIIARTLSATDRRVAELALTKKGKGLLSQARAAMRASAAKAMHGFDAHEKHVVETFLKRFVEAHGH